MKVLFLGASYASSDNRSSDAVARDSERVDEMVELGHEVRCISLVSSIPPHPWWLRANMGDTSLRSEIERAFPGMSFDVAVIDYVWCPVSVTWLTSTYLCNDCQVVSTMRDMGVPLWVVRNHVTSSLIDAECRTWDEACHELPLLQAEDKLGRLIGKNMTANRSAHDGWLVVRSN